MTTSTYRVICVQLFYELLPIVAVVVDSVYAAVSYISYDPVVLF